MLRILVLLIKMIVLSSSSTRVITATANNSASDSGKACYDLSKGEHMRPPQTVEEVCFYAF